MSDDRSIRVQVDGAVTRVTLTRPPFNILTISMMEALTAALGEAVRRPTLKVLVLDADGKAFSAGVAIEDHMGDRVKPMLTTFHQIFRCLHALDCPTVAVVQGAALGGGAELATFCDLVIASETATVGQPEIKVGVFPPIAALRYPCRIGPARTVQLLLSGQTLSAREAERIGLVDRVVPAAELEAAVAAAVAAFTDKSAAVLQLTKRALRMARDDDFDATLSALEEVYLSQLMHTEDAQEGLQAFVDKRPPVWRER